MFLKKLSGHEVEQIYLVVSPPAVYGSVVLNWSAGVAGAVTTVFGQVCPQVGLAPVAMFKT